MAKKNKRDRIKSLQTRPSTKSKRISQLQYPYSRQQSTDSVDMQTTKVASYLSSCANENTSENSEALIIVKMLNDILLSISQIEKNPANLQTAKMLRGISSSIKSVKKRMQNKLSIVDIFGILSSIASILGLAGIVLSAITWFISSQITIPSPRYAYMSPDNYKNISKYNGTPITRKLEMPNLSPLISTMIEEDNSGVIGIMVVSIPAITNDSYSEYTINFDRYTSPRYDEGISLFYKTVEKDSAESTAFSIGLKAESFPQCVLIPLFITRPFIHDKAPETLKVFETKQKIGILYEPQNISCANPKFEGTWLQDYRRIISAGYAKSLSFDIVE